MHFSAFIIVSSAAASASFHCHTSAPPHLVEISDARNVVLPGLPHDFSRAGDDHCCVCNDVTVRLVALQNGGDDDHVVLPSHLQRGADEVEGREESGRREREREEKWFGKKRHTQKM